MRLPSREKTAPFVCVRRSSELPLGAGLRVEHHQGVRAARIAVDERAPVGGQLGLDVLARARGERLGRAAGDRHAPQRLAPPRAEETIRNRPSREKTAPPPVLTSEVSRRGVPPAAGMIQKSPCGPHWGWK